MGMDVNRVVGGEVDEELLCPICKGVLQNPVSAPQCEHAFCQPCITRWIQEEQPTCPVDRQTVHFNQLKPVPRILRNLLARLNVKCDNAESGCQVTVKLDLLESHLKECDYNPKKPVPCDRGCDLTIPKDEMKSHNCIRELRSLIRSQDQTMQEILNDLRDCKYQLAEQRREISILKDKTRNLPSNSFSSSSTNVSNVSAILTTASPLPGTPSMAGINNLTRTVTNQIRVSEVIRWASGLQRARVARWGGIISTPDAVLQNSIQRALTDSGCPEHIVTELMANAHERRWPPGLLTLETRQMNRRQYEQYICKRIPMKQAVVVMACDNTHMSDDMILEPGLVMIFAHGIE